VTGAVLERASVKNLCDPLPGSPKRHAPGRVCAHPDCTTVLSTYNGNSVCYRHDVEPATDAAMERSVFGTKTCRDCGDEKPATQEHWNVDKSRRDGLRSVCIECKRTRDRARNMGKRGPDRCLVSCDEVRNHIRTLVYSGMSYVDIARASGCGEHMVANALYGVTQSMRIVNARRILAVEVRT
jgi:hypothetical protein